MIEVWYKGNIVFTIERADIEYFFLMRNIFKENVTPFKLIPFRVEPHPEGFYVVWYPYGLWIYKDLEIYSISAEKLKSLLEKNEKLIVIWEKEEKREAFWIIDFALSQYTTNEGIEYKTPEGKLLFDLKKKRKKAK
jgi:hypothetical protein